MNLRISSCVAAIGLLLLGSACVDNSKQPAGPGKSGGQAGSGIDFQRVSVGMPSETLDYIGGSAVALAGAKSGNRVFFAVRDDDKATVYRRDLNSGERETVAFISDLLPGTLTSDDAGETFVYNRGKRIDNYIDDPLIREPFVIALPYRYDIATETDEPLFDFRSPEFLPFRSERAGLFISPDGHRALMLSYNIDEIEIFTQTVQWLNLYNDMNEGGTALAEWQLQDPEGTLRMLLLAPYIKPRLRDLGVEPAEEGPVTTEEVEAMQSIRDSLSDIQGTLLINESGEARTLRLSFPEEYSKGYIQSVLAVSNNHVLIYASPVRETGVTPHKLFDVNLESGECRLIGEFLGSASTIEINAAETQVMIVYNPVDLEENMLLAKSNLLRIPLDGGEPQDIELPGDYVAYVDINPDGSKLVGQQSGGNDLFLVDTATAEATLICKLLAPVEGLFINAEADTCAFIENGIIYQVDIAAGLADPASAITGERFAQYEGPVRDFIDKIGFDIPEGLEFEWEEREGLGEHEVSAGIFDPDRPGALALLRYSVDMQTVVSLWFPAQNPFIARDPHTGEDLDYYECKEIAEGILESVGWMDPEGLQEYNPSPNPLYEDRTNSYISIFRDGYWYGDGEDERWVSNADATVRIYAADGTIAEMSLSRMDEVQDQQINLPLLDAEFSLRNQGEYPIPANAPINFDLENYRLVIGQKGEEKFGPAAYTSGMVDRICYEIDAFLQPDDTLMLTGLVDTETGEVLGQITYDSGQSQAYMDASGVTGTITPGP